MKFYFICLMLLVSSLYAQYETSKWYFGYSAAIDFISGSPVCLSSNSIGTDEGSASIASPSGNLLFYTNSIVIKNKLHQTMANGNGIRGHISTTQSALIIRKPGPGDIFYVFTLKDGGNDTLSYSVVDMALAAGNGSVITKNVFLSKNCSEKLGATYHCNGTDVWVMARGLTDYRAFLLTSAGVVTTAVTSTIGASPNHFGQVKFSPNGKKMATPVYNYGSVELYDFDNSTGIVSNVQIFSGSPHPFYPYGVEFSPDGSKLYGSGLYTMINGGAVLQWDLCAGTQSAIANSMVSLSTTTVSKGSLQLAPDGKIYLALMFQNQLSVINNPNAAGLSCGYTENSFTLTSGMSSWGLPNFLSKSFKTMPPLFTATVNPLLSCNTVTFSAPPPQTYTSSSSCLSAANPYNYASWDFGDPASGSLNTSTATNASHVYPGPGTYTVKLLFHGNCGSADTMRKVIVIPGLSVKAQVMPGDTVCAGTTVTLSVAGASNYSWSSGQKVSSFTTTLFQSTTFSVSGQNSTIPCPAGSSVSIVVNPAPALTISGVKKICVGDSTTLVVSGADTYSWSTGSLSPTVHLSPLTNTVYQVSGIDSVTYCGASSQVSLTVEQRPAIFVNSSGTVCVLGTLTAQGANSYTWNNGSQSAIITLTSAGIQTLSVTGSHTINMCVAKFTLTVDALPLPSISLLNDTSICSGEKVTLTASGGGNYLWNTNATTNSIIATPKTTSGFTVTVTNGGCSTQKAVLVNILPCTDIDHITELEDLNVFPNPVTSILSIKVTGINELQLYNEMGLLVFSKIALHSDKEQINFRELDLKVGIYFLRLQTLNGSTANRKIVFMN